MRPGKQENGRQRQKRDGDILNKVPVTHIRPLLS